MSGTPLPDPADPTSKARGPISGLPSRPAFWLGCVGIAILFFALRWNNYDAPLTRDEGEYAYSGRLLLSGKVPYRDSFLQKPPMVAYTYALAGLVAPNTFWFPRALAAAFAAGATLLLGYIAKKEFGEGVALPAMALMTPMILLPGIEQFTANTEMFMLLPLLGTLALYVRCRQVAGGNDDECADGTATEALYQPAASGASPSPHDAGVERGPGRGASHYRPSHGSLYRYWLAAGFLAALAFWYKYTVSPLLAVLFLVWSVEEWRSGLGARSFLRRWLAGIAGACLASILVLAFFLAQDGGRTLWECTVRFNRLYLSAGFFGANDLALRLAAFWDCWWILFLLPCALFVKPPPRVLLWTGFFLMAWFTTATSLLGHYYIVVMPFWALLSAAGIKALSQALAKKMNWSPGWLGRALVAAVFLLVLWPDASWMARTRTAFATDKLKPWPACLGAQRAAQRVAELTASSDLVYVAGSEPEILEYARRFSPTRFVTAYPLIIPTPAALGYQQETISALTEHPPTVIVLARSIKDWPTANLSPPEFLQYLTRVLNRDYERVGGYLPEDPGGTWHEPLTQEDINRAALILFRRKSASAK